MSTRSTFPMVRLRRILAPCVLAAAALAAGAPRAEAADAGAPPPIPACVSVATSSRWVPYGYNHVVVLTNGCASAARCDVSTDVNPDRRSVDVPAGQAVEVLTFMASPSSAFVAKVDCKLR